MSIFSTIRLAFRVCVCVCACIKVCSGTSMWCLVVAAAAAARAENLRAMTSNNHNIGMVTVHSHAIVLYDAPQEARQRWPVICSNAQCSRSN